MANLFDIKSIAVVGASQNPAKLGTVIYNNILVGGFEGKVFPVNPNYPTIMGAQSFPNVSDIPEAVDTVLVVVPAEHVLAVVDDCVKAGEVKMIVVISAGFAEAGAEGKARQQQLVDKCARAGIRLVGPNCLGLLLPHQKLNASFATKLPKPGKIAFAAQSGAFATGLLDMADAENLGFANFITFGNKADLNELDLLQQWENDPQIEVIGMYLEEFRDGNDFVAAANKLTKPLIILKPGQSQQAAAAIASHTGSLAGAAQTIAAALDAAGVIQVQTITELYATLKLAALTKAKTSKTVNDSVVVLTNAGGPAVMVTDLIEHFGLKLAEISKETQAELAKQLPPASSLHNPIDILGDADASRYAYALDILNKDPGVQTILVLLTPQYVTQVEETAKAIAVVASQSQKSIVSVFIGGTQIEHGLEYLWDKGLAAFAQPEQALQAISHLRKRRQQANTTEYIAAAYGMHVDRLRGHLSHYINTTEKKDVVLPSDFAADLARSVGIALPAEKVVDTLEAALAFAAKENFPVVLKLTGEDALHKTEVKGIVLDINSEAKLQQAWADLIAKAKTGKLLIQQQLPKGLELFVGANRDGGANVYTKEGKGFGHLLVFGSGGIYTEVYRDTANVLLPASNVQFRELVQNTKVSQIISGARGKSPLALDALLHQLAAISQLVLTYPEIKSLDINPLILTEAEAVCVDVKIIVSA